MNELDSTSATGSSEIPRTSLERSFETSSEVSLRIENAAGKVEIETHDVPKQKSKSSPCTVGPRRSYEKRESPSDARRAVTK